MEQKDYCRIRKDADTAVLFIHGILGTPRHFADLVPLLSLVPEEWSIHNLLLDGHGSTVADFAKSSMKRWETQTREAFLSLARDHARVAIVGHSMGTLFALQLSREFPDKVPFLFLLNVPLRPYIHPAGVPRMLRLAFGRIREQVPKEMALKLACGVKPTPFLWMYLLCIPRFLELFAENCKTEKLLPYVIVPAYVFQSRQDELVMNHTSIILRRYASFTVQDLPDSSHFYYAPEDRSAICSVFLNQIEEMKKHD